MDKRFEVTDRGVIITKEVQPKIQHTFKKAGREGISDQIEVPFPYNMVCKNDKEDDKTNNKPVNKTRLRKKFTETKTIPV